jgi:hypothetical protein
MSMWLYDEMNEMEDYQNYQKEVRLLEREYLEIRILLRDAEENYQKEVRLLEREYLEIRILLRDAEEDYRKEPESEYLEAKVKYLQKRLKGLESLAARLAADHPLEISLFAPPHG